MAASRKHTSITFKDGSLCREKTLSQSETHGYIRSLLPTGYSTIRNLYMVFLVGMGIRLSFQSD